MLNVGYHCCRAIARVEVVLLDASVAPNGEESGSGAVIADGSNVVSGRYSLIGYSFGAYIPGAGLAVVAVVRAMGA